MGQQLELDERWYEILASSPVAVISRHKISGNLTVWKLDWREHDSYQSTTEAWAAYTKVILDAVVQ